MTYEWYKIMALTEFIESELPSRLVPVTFPDGVKDVLVTRGEVVSILFEDVFITVGLNGENPAEWEGYAVFYDEDDFLWIGIAVAD